ncbi:hypothetical protein [Streptococcus suis]|uniref:hypothetical protein n=1 Tax=Streptococcus suis TaxID=1307 RepID=UPI00163AD8A8|nr:hypothetical protein [Streptococcus suis]
MQKKFYPLDDSTLSLVSGGDAASYCRGYMTGQLIRLMILQKPLNGPLVKCP